MDNKVKEQQKVQVNSDSNTSQNLGEDANNNPEAPKVLTEQPPISSATLPEFQHDNTIEEVTSSLSGVAELGYYFYFLAIAKLLHDQYFRLLDFYFHILIQQRLLSDISITPPESSHQGVNSPELDKDQPLPAAKLSTLLSTEGTEPLAVERASEPLEDELTQLREENILLKGRISKLETEVTFVKGRVSKLEESAKFKFENLIQEAIEKDDEIWDEDNQECQKDIEKAKLWQSKTEALYSLISTAINDCSDRIDSCGDLMKQIQEQNSSLYNSLLNRYKSLELIKRMLERLREPLKLLRECNLPPEQLLRLQKGDLVDLLRSKNNESEAKQVLNRTVKEIGNNRYKSIREWRDLAEKLQKQWLNFIEKKLLPTLDGIRDGKIHAEHLVSELRPSYQTQNLQEYLSNWLKIYDALEITLLEALNQLAVTKMDVQLGKPVDYERHVPIDTESDSTLPHEHIKEIVRDGYDYCIDKQTRILRSAQVIVAINK